MKKKILCLLLCVSLLSCCLLSGCGQKETTPDPATSHQSQDDTPQVADIAYPERQIEIYVPYSAGGVNDLAARLVADYLSEEWGEPVVVINKSGSTATAKEVFSMNADGYTALVMACAELGASVASNYEPPFDINKITYIARLAKFPISFTVNADAPWADLAEFSAWAVEHSDEVTYCAVGMTSPSTFQVAEWMDVIGADFSKARLIASKGSSDGATKVAGGHALLNTGDISASKALIEAGKLKSFGFSPYQHDFYPDIPLASDYVEGLTLGNGVGLMMPDGVDQAIVDKWTVTLEKIYADPDFLADMEKITVMPGYLDAADFEASVQADVEVYTELANKYGLKK